MTESLYVQGFESDRLSKPSAHLMWTSFQPFASSQMIALRVMIFVFAQLNLENQIKRGFQTLANCNYLKSLLGIETTQVNGDANKANIIAIT